MECCISWYVLSELLTSFAFHYLYCHLCPVSTHPHTHVYIYLHKLEIWSIVNFHCEDIMSTQNFVIAGGLNWFCWKVKLLKVDVYWNATSWHGKCDCSLVINRQALSEACNSWCMWNEPTWAVISAVFVWIAQWGSIACGRGCHSRPVRSRSVVSVSRNAHRCWDGEEDSWPGP